MHSPARRVVCVCVCVCVCLSGGWHVSRSRASLQLARTPGRRPPPMVVVRVTAKARRSGGEGSGEHAPRAGTVGRLAVTVVSSRVQSTEQQLSALLSKQEVDAEVIHDVRVELRRLRNGLATVAPVLALPSLVRYIHCARPSAETLGVGLTRTRPAPSTGVCPHAQPGCPTRGAPPTCREAALHSLRDSATPNSTLPPRGAPGQRARRRIAGVSGSAWPFTRAVALRQRPTDKR